MDKTQVVRFWRSSENIRLLVEHWQELGSTNDRARQLCTEGSCVVLVTAQHQTSGRGRHQRRWLDSAGAAILMSLGLPAQWCSTISPACILAASSLAVLEELRRYTLPQRLRLKYPNDIWAQPSGMPAGKVAGILVESDYIGSACQSVVVGVGVNLTAAPHVDGANYPARAVADVATTPLLEPHEHAQRIAERFLWMLDNEEHSEIIAQWQRELGLTGRVLQHSTEKLPVVVVGFAAEGTLLCKRLDSGELVTVRDADSLYYDPFAL